MSYSQKAKVLLDTEEKLPSERILSLTEMKLSETRTYNTAITFAHKGKKLRNPCSLIFGKYSELPKGLSITMYIIGNSIDFSYTK